ncbi:MAG: phosphate signaling complex protein PhoU [Oscillospiraceae bacterium]
MRNRFETQLKELTNNLTLMGALCENSISLAIKAFMEGNDDYAKKAIEVDKQIDQMEKEIESMCLKLLLQQQPVAKDLRVISAALKMITDIERIGDQASDIAEISGYANLSDSLNKIRIKDMAIAAIKMVTDAIDAFVKVDLELANQVILYDDVVDNSFLQVKSDIIELISKDKASGEIAIDMMMIAKYLERIADHATNIAEWVVFSITGKHEEE